MTALLVWYAFSEKSPIMSVFRPLQLLVSTIPSVAFADRMQGIYSRSKKPMDVG